MTRSGCVESCMCDPGPSVVAAVVMAGSVFRLQELRRPLPDWAYLTPSPERLSLLD